jgi:hypothetical protein
MPVAVLDDRPEALDLGPRLEHRLMRARQILEMGDHMPDALFHLGRLQHVGAHKIGEVADGFIDTV